MRARRWVWAAGGAGVLLLALASPLACTTTVRPPDSPSEPVDVFLIDYGTTSALALPGEGGLIAYAYGDWQYYARRNDNLFRGIAALTWPTQGTLGRGELRAAATADAVLAQLRGRGAERVQVLRVEASAAERLRRRLDAEHAARQDTEVRNETYAMRFVHHPRRYTWFWNSNHQTAAWLEELGCEVRGPAFASRWNVEGG